MVSHTDLDFLSVKLGILAQLGLGVLVRHLVQLSLGLLAQEQRDPVDCLGWKKDFT